MSQAMPIAMPTARSTAASALTASLASHLAGRRIAITGAGRGLGAALAQVLAEAGAEVVLLGRSAGRLAATASSIGQRVGQVPATIALDLANIASIEAASAELHQRYQHVDVLINNGSFYLDGAFATLSPTAVFESVNSIITGTALITQAVMPLLLRSGAGDIVMVVSMSGLHGLPKYGSSSVYYAAKHGQAALADGLRQEMQGSSLRVLAVYPPGIEAVAPSQPQWQQLPARPKNSGINTRNVIDSILFALIQPRNCSLASIVLDADVDGMYQ
jgi:short-subunit dehydrogenase